MSASYSFHPEALAKYSATLDYYLHVAAPEVAEAFVETIEGSITKIVAAPDRWRILESPGIRRYVCKRFPFVLYYRWESERDRVEIYAIMHCSRQPGYWRERASRSGESN